MAVAVLALCAVTAEAGSRARAIRSEGPVVPVTIDTTDVVDGSGQPVSAGGYVALVRFDPALVRILRVDGGTDAPFQTQPIVTHLEKANAAGELRLVGVQTDMPVTPALMNVARVYIEELVADGAGSMVVTIESLASTVARDAAGKAVVSAIEVDE